MNLPSVEQPILAEYAEGDTGMEIDSWVVENALLLHLSSSSDHDSLDFGHSSKKRKCWMMLYMASWATIIAKEAMLLSLICHCSIITFISSRHMNIRVSLQIWVVIWFHQGVWVNLGWHQTPCVVHISVHPKTPDSARNYRKWIMLICIRSQSLERPAYFIIHCICSVNFFFL